MGGWDGWEEGWLARLPVHGGRARSVGASAPGRAKRGASLPVGSAGVLCTCALPDASTAVAAASASTSKVRREGAAGLPYLTYGAVGLPWWTTLVAAHACSMAWDVGSRYTVLAGVTLHILYHIYSRCKPLKTDYLYLKRIRASVEWLQMFCQFRQPALICPVALHVLLSD
jgi:hypothetical protein